MNDWSGGVRSKLASPSQEQTSLVLKGSKRIGGHETWALVIIAFTSAVGGCG